ncbi:MAG: NUDIX domain-containing protein [Thermaerobacter sp.]|nr:NUDIX domain-containing protein [Thermaerobacter sp.]
MTEESAGGLVVRGQEVLMIRDRFGRWTFPKGHLEPGETARQAAAREVLEETGVRAAISARLGRVEYALPGGNSKKITFYLMRFEGGELAPLHAEISEARWFTFDAAQEQLRAYGYPGYRVMLRRARELSARWPQA